VDTVGTRANALLAVDYVLEGLVGSGYQAGIGLVDSVLVGSVLAGNVHVVALDLENI
jgi:hypothetical protein